MSKRKERLNELTPDFLRHDPAAIISVYEIGRAAILPSLRYVGEEAEDIYQDAFLYMTANVEADKLAERDGLYSLLYTKAHNLARDYIRKQSRRVDYEYHDEPVELEELDAEPPHEPKAADYGAIDYNTPEEEVHEDNLRKRIEVSVRERMGDRMWEIYHAIIIEERTYADVAEQYGIGVRTLHNYVGLVNELLREVLLAGVKVE